MVKLTDRCFCRFTAAMLVPLGRAPTWRFHTKLYKFGWSTFPNNARMKNHTELNFGKVFYVWLIYHIQDSWLNSLNGYDIYFWLRDTANQPYHAWETEFKLTFLFKQISQWVQNCGTFELILGQRKCTQQNALAKTSFAHNIVSL